VGSASPSIVIPSYADRRLFPLRYGNETQVTTDPTMRIVWFGGRPFPVSSHPSGPEDPGTHWYVQTEDGEWHPVVERRPSASDLSQRVVEAVTAWLEVRAARDRRTR
jgi:hypothetical protein